MSKLFKYVPIFRVRQEEVKVLKSFDFGNKIYPYLEIIKELDREPRKASKSTTKPSRKKIFEDVYLPLLESIKVEQVFVDLPVHLKPDRQMKRPTILFLRNVVANRHIRTEYLKKFTPLSSKVIPVISTFSQVTGELGSITIQEKDLRPFFKTIAFRTFFNTFSSDITQIKALIQKDDYVIMDWGGMELDADDDDIMDIVVELEKLNCNVIVHRNPFPSSITLSGLVHGEIIDNIDNSLLNTYGKYGGNGFSDYVGIKKDNISDGGVVSPGFIYYDPIYNVFYGYKGQPRPRLEEFEKTIVPAVIRSDATIRMQGHALDFLGSYNCGWKIIKNIELGLPDGESGKSAPKFKRISMEHYLHCIRTKISNGDFD